MFQHVLVPLDESALAESVLPHVGAVARPGHTRVTLLRVLDPPSQGDHEQPLDAVQWQLAKGRAGSYLAAVAAGLEAIGLEVEYRVLEGDPALVIAAFTADERVDLVAMASHGSGGFTGHDLGAVAHKVALRITTHLLVARSYHFVLPTGPTTHDVAVGRTGRDVAVPAAVERSVYQRVMVPLDRSQRAEAALVYAARLAETSGADVELVHVHAPWAPLPSGLPSDDTVMSSGRSSDMTDRHEAERYLERRRHDLSRPGRTIRTHLIVAPDVNAALHDRMRESAADIVVMSAHGCSGSGRWRYGGHTLNMLLYGTAPLLVIQDRPHHEIEASPSEIAAKERKGH